MEELEDSLPSLPGASQGEEVAQLPRKLGRLRKARTAAENAQPNLKAPSMSPAKPALSDEADVALDEGEEQPSSPALAEEEEGQAAASPSRQEEDVYYDEEDELEQHFARTQQAQPVSEDGDGSLKDGGHSSEPEASAASGSPCGSPGTLELLAADTQRILRETAARDRLGKGHKIEIKPLSSILDRIKQRQALAIARAPKPALPDVGDFDDILDQARQQAGVPAADSSAGAADQGGADATAAEVAGGADPAGESQQAGVDVGDDGADDLLIMSSDDEGAGGLGARLVELPSTAKKPKRMPFVRTQEDDYEDVLIDDGYNSAEEEEEGEEANESEDDSAVDASSDVEDEEERTEGGSQGRTRAQSPAASARQALPSGKRMPEAAQGSPPDGHAEEGSACPTSSGSQEEGPREAQMDVQATSDASGEATAPAAAAAVSHKAARVQRAFLDMEAELSEEEGGGASEDEEEDMDDRGELAGLIGEAKETGRDRKMRQLLHRQWAEAQDEKELQQVMRGLKNGFRRRRGAGFLDDDEDEGAGRRRRARAEDEDGEGGGPALPWPSPFGDVVGSDEEAEDAELLRKAQQGLLLAGSEGMEVEGEGAGYGLAGSGSFAGSIPLDEDSQEVLGLLARSCGSEPQLGGGAGSGSLPRSRFAPPGAAAPLASFGSDPTAGRLPGGTAPSLSRGPSFVGRQPTAQRTASCSGLGGGRSFVFGRDDSNSALPQDKGTQMDVAGSTGDTVAAGPTSFANLRQMAGMPPQHRKRAGATLVSRLKAPARRTGKEPAGSQPEGVSADAAAAAVALIAGSARGGH